MLIEENKSLFGLNTFGLQANAKYFTEIYSPAHLLDLLSYKITKQENIFPLGGGSNILLTKDVDALVVYNQIKGINLSKEDDDLGYAGNESSEVIIGIRDVKINQAVFDMVYNIDSYKEIALEFRNYWSSVNYKRYYNLQDNGIGNPIVNYPFDENPNANFNIWNLDLSYSWWFAPGSQMSVLYRNNAASFDRNINKDFNSNLSNLFQGNLNHILSISVRYFIDYNQAKNWIKKG